FFPAFLCCHWSAEDQPGSGAHNHYARVEQAERIVFMQTPRQDYRQSNLIKLKPGPVGGPIDPTVLRKTAIRPLDRCQPDQRSQRRARLTRGKERACTLYEVARPHEMIATEV